MSEFVILFHKMPETSSRADHWDLMLEWEGSLVVWALESLPIEGETIRGTRLPDHRWDYLQIQGPLTGGRGTVAQWAKGKCQWLERGTLRQVVQLEASDISWRVTIVDSKERSATVKIESHSDGDSALGSAGS